MRPKSKGTTSHRFQASDEKYITPEFISWIEKVRTAVVPDWYVHLLRKHFKEYMVTHLRRAVKTYYHTDLHFEYSDLLVDCARRHHCGAHFVNCFLETANNCEPFDYVPSKRYPFWDKTGPAFRDILQRILKDSEYTAKKHFSGLRKLKTINQDDVSALTEIKDGLNFISKVDCKIKLDT